MSLTAFFHILQLWNIKPGWGSRPDIHVDKAHSDDISGLRFSIDGQMLLSRSMDGTLKVSLCQLTILFHLVVYNCC